MQNFGVTNKEYYGMLWYFLEGSIVSAFLLFMFLDQLLFVDMFSQLYYLTDAKKTTTMSDLPLQIVKIMKNR